MDYFKSSSVSALVDQLNLVLRHIPLENRKELVLNQPVALNGHTVGNDTNEWWPTMRPFIGDERFKVFDFLEHDGEAHVRVMLMDDFSGEDKEIFKLTHRNTAIAMTGYKEFLDALMMLVDDSYVVKNRPKETLGAVEKEQEDPLWGSW